MRSSLLCAFLLSFLSLTAQQRYQNLQEALASSGKLNGKAGPRSVNWIDEGKAFSFLEEQKITTFSPVILEGETIFDAQQQSEPFTYQSFEWSKDAQYILFQSNFRPIYRRSGISDYYIYSIDDKSLKLVAKDAQTAQLSPDGKKVAYEREGNLYTYTFATEEEQMLTRDGNPEQFIWNGRFGWVYEEEFGLAQAWVWSPDSKYIAFWQTDESQVPIFQMTDYQNIPQLEWEKIPYPKVGEENPTVKIGIIDVIQQRRQWVNIDLAGGYIPRLYWTSVSGQLAVAHLNRKQNHLKLFFTNSEDGKANLIMEEKSEQWIDVFDFFAGIMHLFFFPENSKEFFWVSDRDGWSHIYRYDYKGKLLNQVTKGNWEVTYLHQIDAKRKTIYYTSTEVSPLERHLYSIDFSGKDKKRLTQEPGTHNINFSPNGQYYLDTYSNINTPTQVALWDTKGKQLKTFEDNQAVSDYVKTVGFAPKELMQFTNSDGQRIDMHIIKPVDFDSTKAYPLLLNIYGGPGAQSVYNEWRANGWEQYLAQEGYVIASVNNRGSGGYGSQFEKMVYEQLGKYESKDFVEAAQYLGKQAWVDANRMAIRGHSYGGYMSSYTMLTHPEVFKVALIGAPVTDWRLYDSIYTERYMGLMPENEHKYVQSASTTHAKNLKGKMFIAHSAMDENVHVQNTFQLVKALIDNGKDADLRIYPPGAHGVAYNGASYLLLYQQYVDYLATHLK